MAIFLIMLLTGVDDELIHFAQQKSQIMCQMSSFI